MNRAIDWRGLRRSLKGFGPFTKLAQASSLDLALNAVSTQLLAELNRTVPDREVVASLLGALAPVFDEDDQAAIQGLLASNNISLS
jgi:hypothetical protein